MKRAANFIESEKETMRTMRESGRAICDIIKVVKRRHSTVKRWLDANNITSPTDRYDPSLVIMVRKALLRGLNVLEASQETGVSTSAIYVWISKKKLPKPHTDEMIKKAQEKWKWTPEKDQIIIDRRLQGDTWDKVAVVLNITTYKAYRRGLFLARTSAAIVKNDPPKIMAKQPMRGDQDMFGMRPGHPVSWGAITSGTSMDGVPWPYDG